MKKDFVYLVALAVLALFLFKECGKEGAPGQDKVIIKSDTIRQYIKGKPDTVYFERTKIVYRDLPPDTVIILDDSTSLYTTTIKDSLIEGEITAKVKGELLSTDFNYRPLFPKYITRVDTFKGEITTEIERNRYEFSIGAIAGANTNAFSFSPTVMLRTKKSLAFTLGYDLLQKTYNLGGFYRLGR